MKKLNIFKNFFNEMEKDLRKEQKAFYFHKKAQEEEKEYFNFFKFIFQSPDGNKGF